MEISISKEETSRERIIEFLDATGDFNEVHRNGSNVFPGMFYFALSARHMNPEKPLSFLEIQFKNMIEYPMECRLIQEKTADGERFFFKDRERVLCEQEVKYNEKKQVDNSGAERFADLLQVQREHSGLKAIVYASRIPGEIVRFFGGKPGVYIRQSMNFLPNLPLQAGLDIRLQRERKKMKWLSTDYYEQGERVADGEAVIASLS